jgi:hypothetical protein
MLMLASEAPMIRMISRPMVNDHSLGDAWETAQANGAMAVITMTVTNCGNPRTLPWLPVGCVTREWSRLTGHGFNCRSHRIHVMTLL